MKVYKIKLSDEFFGATESTCFPTSHNTTAAKKREWIRKQWRLGFARIVGPQTESTRVISIVKVRIGNRMRLFVMDAVTGSLFDPRDGVGISENNSRICAVSWDEKKATWVLMKTNSSRRPGV